MHRNGIVSESLCGKLGYVKWSTQMKTYLLGQDLWDVVESDEPATHDDNGTTATESEIKAWRKNNALALHTIQISCYGEAFTLIQNISSAKIAWDTLAANYTQQLVQDCKESESEYDDDDFDDDSENESNSPATDADLHQYESLLKAVQSGDWKEAKSFLAKHPDAVRARITCSDKNALHVAVAAGHSDIVEKLVPLMTAEDVLMKQKDGCTALAIAVEIGNISIAECLIRKNKKLVRIDVNGRLPVVYAVLNGHMHMVRFLYSVTPIEDLTLLENAKQGSELISLCVYRNHFDIALHLLEHCPRLAITPHAHWRSPVVALANSKVFASVGQLRFWQRWIYNRINVPDCAKNHISLDVQNLNDSLTTRKDITVITSGVFGRSGEALFGLLGQLISYLFKFLDVKHIYEMKLVHVQSLELLSRMCKAIGSISDPKLITVAGVHNAMSRAVHNGNVEFIKSMAKANPELVWTPSTARNIFSLAIQLHQAKVFSLIYGFHHKEALLALPLMGPPLHPMSMPCQWDLIPGPALQLQRNLQWDKEVETIFPLTARDCWSSTGYLRPFDLCRKEDKDLVIAAKKWMKDISRSCFFVGALILTIMLAAALILHRGNNQVMGIPVISSRKLLKVFMISDALSLFSSTISVLMFLGILTSRYAKEDFLKSLPTKMIIGLSTLFFSIATMMIAFLVALPTMLREDSWISIAVLLPTILVTLSFLWMHFPLLVDIFISTYGPSIVNRKVKPWLYG